MRQATRGRHLGLGQAHKYTNRRATVAPVDDRKLVSLELSARLIEDLRVKTGNVPMLAWKMEATDSLIYERRTIESLASTCQSLAAASPRLARLATSRRHFGPTSSIAARGYQQ